MKPVQRRFRCNRFVIPRWLPRQSGRTMSCYKATSTRRWPGASTLDINLGAHLSQISLRRSHKLPHTQAVAAADAIAARLKADYGMQSRWQGDTLHFERTGASGTLRLAPQEVHLEVRLGLLLSAFRDSIAQEVERQLDEQLGTKRTQPARKKG